MPETRNLTQLASPFGEGKGEAYILPSGKTDPYFFQALEQIKKDKAAEKDRQQKALELRAKAIENWSPNYWMGHQGYFQDKVSGVKSDLEDLMVNGGIKNGVWDMNNPKVREAVTTMNKTTQDAKLSTQWGAQMQKWWTSPESQKKLYTPESRQAYEDYALNNTNFDGDFAGLVNKQPQLVPSTPLPKDIATGTAITHFNQALPKDIVDAKDVDEANKKSDDYAQSIYDRVMALPLSTSEFANAWSADDPTAPERQREAMAETMKEQVKKVILDKFKLTKIDQGQQKIDQTKVYQGGQLALGKERNEIAWLRASIAGKKLDLDTYKAGATGDETDPTGVSALTYDLVKGDDKAGARIGTVAIPSVATDEKGKPLMATPQFTPQKVQGNPHILNQAGQGQDPNQQYWKVEYDNPIRKIFDKDKEDLSPKEKELESTLYIPINGDVNTALQIAQGQLGKGYVGQLTGKNKNSTYVNPENTMEKHKNSTHVSATTKQSGSTKSSGVNLNNFFKK